MENIIIYFKQGSFMGNVELLIGFFLVGILPYGCFAEA